MQTPFSGPAASAPSSGSLQFSPRDTSQSSVMCELQRGCHSCGGMLPAGQIVSLMRPLTAQPISVLARWIVERKVIHVVELGESVLPLFQFNPGLTSVRPEVATLIAEFEQVYDDMELALWFVRPNAALGGESPAACLERDSQAVLDTARLDRFLIAGS